jgi:hypothetical protein
MRLLFMVIGVIVSVFSGFSQKRVVGLVTDKEGKVLNSAHLTLKDRDRIVSFYITGEDGSYAIDFPIGKDSLVLSATKLGYTAKALLISSNIQKIDFTLEEGNVELDEIIIKSPPVRRFGDTLSYKISEFKSGSDRTIGDVISKLPGIEVDASGRISYHGKPINRYYMDNLNLLDGRYGLVNNNLSFDKVVEVEVFENHQPIRILDSLQFSESAALNLKLKNKVTKTAVAKLGLGGSPFLWDVTATPMVFMPNLQFLSTVQSNNSGRSISNQFMDFFAGSSIASNVSWLSIPPVPTPPFNAQKWLDNQSHAGSVNILKKVWKETDLKFNTNLLLDKQSQRGLTAMTYLLGNENFGYTENISNRFNDNQFNSSLELVQNTKKNYFRNRLCIDKKWKNDSGINLREASRYNQKNDTGDMTLSNNFHKIFNVRKNTINFYSLSAYKNANQELAVNLTGVDTSASPIQDFNLSQFNTHNYIELTKRIHPVINVVAKLGTEIESTSIGSELNNYRFLDSVVTSNDFRWDSYRNYLSAGLNFTPGNWLFSIAAPSALALIKNANRMENETHRFKRFVVEPRLYIRLKNNSHTTYFISANYRNTLARLGDIYGGVIMTNYLNVIQKDAGFRDNHIYSGTAGVEYNHMVSMFSFFVNYNYSYTLQNLLAENSINNDGTRTVTYTERPNAGTFQTINFGGSKYIFPLKTSLTFGTTFTQSVTQRYINEEFKSFHQMSIAPSLGVNFSMIKWLEMNYRTSYAYVENSSSQFNQFNQVFSLGLLSFKNTLIKFNGEHYSLKTESADKSYFFGDILFRYKIPKIRQDFEVNFSNILNQHTFRNILVNDYFIQETSFVLRPRQVLLTGRLSF